MLKRAIIATILLSMVLHSASRLGVLSYAYQQRHHFAQALGLIAEIPIAMCNSDYHFNDQLLIVTHDSDEDSSVPSPHQAREIHLFLNEIFDIAAPSRLITSSQPVTFVETRYSSPPLSILHPPC